MYAHALYSHSVDDRNVKSYATDKLITSGKLPHFYFDFIRECDWMCSQKQV